MMNAKRSSKINLTRYAFLVPAVITLLLVFSISKADFAKPIRLKLANAVKPLENIITVTALPNPAGNMPLPKLKKISRMTAKTLPVVKPDTNTWKKLDTGKWKKLVITKTGGMDSIVCYINGVRGSLKSVDPNNMAQVTVIKGDRLSTDLPAYINIDDVKNVGVVLIVTKDSPEGKVIERSKQSNDITVTGYKVNPRVNVTSATVKTYATTAVSTGTTVNVTPYVAIVDTAARVNVKSNSKANTIRVTSVSNVSVNGKSTASQNISVDNNKGMHISFDKDKTPLIIVDGKEITATEMKNLNPNTIESMTVLNDESTIKKYGSKAKDGAILINTKRRPLKD